MTAQTPHIDHNDKFVVPDSTLEHVPDSNLETNRRNSTQLPQTRFDKEAFSEPEVHTPKEPVATSIPKSRRKIKRLAIAVVVIVVILAAVLGGVLGSRAASQSGSQPQESNLPNNTEPVNPDAIDISLPEQFVRLGSPLTVIPGNAWTPWQNIDDRETQTVFYQTARGNMGLSGRNQGGWTTDSVLLTDQTNGTGIAAVTYQNGSNIQYSLFYVGYSTGSIREKRQLNGSNYWELGPLSFSFNSVPVNGTGEARWQIQSLAAVYSTNFSTGPGTRLYYHQKNANSSWIQELVWIQKNDSWSQGSQIKGIPGNGHISAVIENSSQCLRLFYGVNNTIDEMWFNITNKNSTWQKGVSLPVLSHTSAGFTAVAGLNTTYIYYPVNGSVYSSMDIVEMRLPRIGEQQNTSGVVPTTIATSNLTSDTVAANGLGQFLSVGGTASGGVITVIYPEHGYGALTALTKNEGASWNDGVRNESIPLFTNT